MNEVLGSVAKCLGLLLNNEKIEESVEGTRSSIALSAKRWIHLSNVRAWTKTRQTIDVEERLQMQKENVTFVLSVSLFVEVLRVYMRSKGRATYCGNLRDGCHNSLLFEPQAECVPLSMQPGQKFSHLMIVQGHWELLRRRAVL